MCVSVWSERLALLSTLVGWVHLSLKMGDLWSWTPANLITTSTELWKFLSIAHWPNWITSSALFRARLLNGWFEERTCARTHTHMHKHTTLHWIGVSIAVYFFHLQSRKIPSAFSQGSCFDRFLIEFFSVFACVCLCLCILICRQGFCFHHTVSAVYGELFAS